MKNVLCSFLFLVFVGCDGSNQDKKTLVKKELNNLPAVFIGDKKFALGTNSVEFLKMHPNFEFFDPDSRVSNECMNLLSYRYIEDYISYTALFHLDSLKGTDTLIAIKYVVPINSDRKKIYVNSSMINIDSIVKSNPNSIINFNGLFLKCQYFEKDRNMKIKLSSDSNVLNNFYSKCWEIEKY